MYPGIMVSPENESNPITASLFMKGFFATLLLSGTEYVPTINDKHQERFGRVALSLRERKQNGDPAMQRMPDFTPEVITGKYEELDHALITFQSFGITERADPYFSSMKIVFSAERARRQLERFSEEEQQALFSMTKEFLQADNTQYL